MQVKQLPKLQGQQRLGMLFGSGEELIHSLAEVAKTRSILGAHFTGIGALRAAMLGFFDIARREYRRFGIDEQVEVLSLMGNIAMEDGESRIHAHIVVGRFNGSTLGGHLLEAHVRPTLEVVLVETPAALRRRFDPATGLALLDLSDLPPG
jgi:predicted DNA-binding protein with PD1-like motif